MEMQTKVCRKCGDEFEGNDKTVFCPKCRNIRYDYITDKTTGKPCTCVDCGAEYIRNSPAQKYCEACRKKHQRMTAYKSKAKYNKNNYDRIEFKVAKGQKENILAHAKTQGESLNQFLNRAVDNQIAKDNGSDK